MITWRSRDGEKMCVLPSVGHYGDWAIGRKLCPKDRVYRRGVEYVLIHKPTGLAAVNSPSCKAMRYLAKELVERCPKHPERHESVNHEDYIEHVLRGWVNDHLVSLIHDIMIQQDEYYC